MKKAILLATVCAGLIGVSGCARTVPVERASGAPGPVTSVQASAQSRWTASIQPVSQESRFNVPDSSRDRSYGTAQWRQGELPTLSRVTLAFDYAGPERDLSWAILFGPCGSASLPVIPRTQFPELDVSGGGSAQVTATLSVTLPTSGAYHIEIYKNRQGGAEAIVGCGNLKYVGG